MISDADRSAIQELLSRYCHSIDAHRADLCAGLFCDDAVLETPVGNANGASAIRAWIEDRLAQRQEGVQVRHLVTSTLLVPLDSGSVRTRSTLLYTWETLEMPRWVIRKSRLNSSGCSGAHSSHRRAGGSWRLPAWLDGLIVYTPMPRAWAASTARRLLALV